VSTSSLSYVFISYIAEIAGWYNLFLGGSVYALWELLGSGAFWAVSKIHPKISKVMTKWWKVLFLLSSIGALIYIFVNCILTLVDNPVGTSTVLTRSINSGISLSVCLSKLTSLYDRDNLKFIDVANTTGFWETGNNLSNKISSLSISGFDGAVLTLWNKSQVPIPELQHLFSNFNIISSNQTIDFCHTIELSALPIRVRNVQVRAVNDITLIIHLAGQLFASHLKYSILNDDTVKTNDYKFIMYGSEVNFQWEETSFTAINTEDCENYNTTWTYDTCRIDFALKDLGSRSDLVKNLLRPSDSKVQQGVDQYVLKSLYSSFLSQTFRESCRPDCRSLVVNMGAETSQIPAQPKEGIVFSFSKKGQPLPPITVEVNITLAELSKLNEVGKTCVISSK
jgi:hypothetical protein